MQLDSTIDKKKIIRETRLYELSGRIFGLKLVKSFTGLGRSVAKHFLKAILKEVEITDFSQKI
jgi:hypothetical protein